MLKKFCIVVLAVVVLIAAAVFVWAMIPRRVPAPVMDSLDTDPAAVSGDEWGRVIAYVPLDDRTDNMEDVVYLAEASGYKVVMPEGDVYCTKLDGQAPNANGTQYGDREALMEWVREMDGLGCDLFLLSLDQLFSGGLVNSRSISGEAPLTFPDGTVLNETDAFDQYILSLADDPANRIYLFDSVVRLASTVGYQGFDLPEYEALRAYGMVARPALEGDALTIDDVFADYPYGEDGVTPAEDFVEGEENRSVLTPELIEGYLGVRRRKLQLTDHVIAALDGAEHGNIKLLIGIDDSSNTTNIQYNELHYIEQRLGRGSTLLTGLDSLARLLVGQIAQEEYGVQVKTSVRYVGGSQEIPSSEYDRYTLEKVVDLHMDLLKAERVGEDEAELQILVMTAPDDPDKAGAYCEELISKLEENIAGRVPTILIEASNNAYGDTLEQMLFDRVDFGSLVAFTGKYDQANVTGAGFAMGFSRYLYLKFCQEKSDAADVAQVRQMANSIALTYPYILHTRYPLNLFINRLGLNYNNILPNRVQDKLIYWKLNKLFLPLCDAVTENLEGTALISSLEPYAEKEITGVSITDVYFPWNRTFELSFTVNVEPLREAS